MIARSKTRSNICEVGSAGVGHSFPVRAPNWTSISTRNIKTTINKSPAYNNHLVRPWLGPCSRIVSFIDQMLSTLPLFVWLWPDWSKNHPAFSTTVSRDPASATWVNNDREGNILHDNALSFRLKSLMRPRDWMHASEWVCRLRPGCIQLKDAKDISKPHQGSDNPTDQWLFVNCSDFIYSLYLLFKTMLYSCTSPLSVLKFVLYAIGLTLELVASHRP